jgi:hypothetical protein
MVHFPTGADKLSGAVRNERYQEQPGNNQQPVPDPSNQWQDSPDEVSTIRGQVIS